MKLHLSWLLVIALSSACAVEDDDGSGVDAGSDTRSDENSSVGTVGLIDNGVPIDGYPSYDERLMLVAINRARSDPNSVAGGTADECSEWRDPVPPVVYDHDAGQAARFHCDHLMLNQGGLSHATFCELREDIEATGCDGRAECSCVPATECWSCETLGGCGTNYGGRMDRFGFAGSPAGEVGGAGYGSGWSATGGWVTESPCHSSTVGHRNIVTSPSANVVGTGSANGSAGGSVCWSNYQFADFGSIAGLEIPALVSGIHSPERGSETTTFTFYANVYDARGDTAAVYVVIDGECHPMTVELGGDGNATTIFSGQVAEPGCSEYFFMVVHDFGRRVTYPDTGSFLLSAGEECESGYTERQAAAICN